MSTLVSMMPLIVLFVVPLIVRSIAARRGSRGDFGTWPGALCAGVATTFVLTGAGHFVGMREELIRMVPPALGDAGFWVTFTGVAELAGAVGILVPATRKLAALGLVVLLVAVFPANVHELSLQHAPLASFLGRAAEQLVYLAAVLVAGFGPRRRA
ncbi:hypothetical protein [Sandaracinus amylolyticus]|uniref:DoxX family protein n=1 Tax=Sandaracinus amylolyticus TaxID=927083 RepID=UPI001F371B35|nr:hypothetical protein [Sandaracinus amylolyticus]UJR84332.1 Hypothetical protein I5071_64110 [Sandaracinus amylolyticus]